MSLSISLTPFLCIALSLSLEFSLSDSLFISLPANPPTIPLSHCLYVQPAVWFLNIRPCVSGFYLGREHRGLEKSGGRVTGVAGALWGTAGGLGDKEWMSQQPVNLWLVH